MQTNSFFSNWHSEGVPITNEPDVSILPTKRSVQPKINELIERGIFFKVETDSFKVVPNGNVLTEEETEYLKLNRSAVLCHLQQMSLLEHLFDQSLESLEIFSIEVRDRELDLIIEGKDKESAYELSAFEVTKNWYDELLKEL